MRELIIAVAAVVVFLVAGQQAVAWNKTTAIQYAERHVYSPNPAWPTFPADCTNFVSQALHAGGIRMDTTVTDRRNWFMTRNIHGTWIWGFPWTVAHDFHEYFRTNARTAPHRYFVGSYDHNPNTIRETPSNSNAALGNGDIISFDWNGDQRIDHVGIVTRQNTTDRYNPAFVGDLVTYRSTDTRNIIWHLRHRLSPAQRETTRILAWGLTTALR